MPFAIPILLIPLLGGFIFVSYCNRTKWYAVRAEKERLLLHASIAGFIYLVIAWAITSSISHIPCISSLWCFSDAWASWQRLWTAIRPFPYFGTALLSFVLASLAWLPLNQYYFDNDDETYRVIVQEGGPLEQLLDSAMHSRKQVIVTLKTNKVYIGLVDSSFTPAQLSRTIRVWPMKSGYRGSDNMTFVETADYYDVYKSIEEDFKKQGRTAEEAFNLIEDFRVVMALDDIASISLYWEEVSSRYFKKTVSRDTPLPSFETTRLPAERKEDPILRVLNSVGDFFLYPVFEDSKSKRARGWRIGWGAGVIVLLVMAFLYLISN